MGGEWDWEKKSGRAKQCELINQTVSLEELFTNNSFGERICVAGYWVCESVAAVTAAAVAAEHVMNILFLYVYRVSHIFVYIGNVFSEVNQIDPFIVVCCYETKLNMRCV